ncbi:MAG: leucine-rich repeat domain-containing protein [Prevotella sp.]|nr:leucine-rich repeat domain-containing protein [Prevotella sp.]
MIKKFFTTLLLLTAVVAANALPPGEEQPNPLSVSFADGVLTVNYSDRVGTVTEDFVNKALNNWRDTYFSDVQGGPAEKDAAMKAAVQTIKLTGDWTNLQLKKDDKTIHKIIEKCGEQQVGVGLDLSECNKMTCKYQSMEEVYDDATNNGSITFHYTPTGATETISIPVTITQQSSQVTKGVSYHLHHAGGTLITFETDADGEVVDDSWTPNPLPDGFKKVFKGSDGYYVYQSEHYSAKLFEVESYTYTDVNGNVQTLTQDQVNNLRTDGDGNLWYDYNTYNYTDKYGNPVSTTSTANPYNLTEAGYDDQGNMTYTYNYTVTSEGFSFDGYESSLSSVSFPNHADFTFIPNDILKSSNSLTSVTIPANIRAIGNHAFASATKLEEVNFPDNLEEIGGGAFEYTKIPGADLRNTKITQIHWCTFMENPEFAYCYYPDALTRIQYNAFKKDTKIKTVDLSQCHWLTLISTGAYETCSSITKVVICSHPKILRGNGHGTGCFNNCKAIDTVQVVSCYLEDYPVTDVTKCYCEIGAFDYDITEVQTQLANVSKGAKLIFPNDMPVGNNQTYAGTSRQGSGEGGNVTYAIENGSAYTNQYTSSFDFFVGDYKAGVLITQSSLQVFFDDVPNNLGPAPGYGAPTDQPDLGELVPGVANGTVKVVGDTRYAYNGWMEFINTTVGEVVPKGEFLRTYSRSAGDGPCMLPKEITAYRAVDYTTDQFAYVLDRNGEYYYDATIQSDNEDDKYKLIDGVIAGTEPDEIISEEELAYIATIGDGKRYSHLTIGGKLYLRPLVAKVAQYPGIEGGYVGDNIELFDADAVYDQLQTVPGGYSYVPENTGVVLYSTKINESALLILGGDFGTETVYKEFPHTYQRYEAGRLTSDDTSNNINMLHGSFGDGWPVSPVFPWKYKNASTCSGGHFPTDRPREYRNFACVMTHAATGTGGLADRNTYGWKRLQPSRMKENRAFAQIPAVRFDNFNEDADSEQFPGFTIEDTTAEVPAVDGEGTQTSNNSNLMLISIFEGDSEDGADVDGIKEIKNVESTVAKTKDNAWYTLQGVRVSSLTKGVYIHNGKKVVIK